MGIAKNPVTPFSATLGRALLARPLKPPPTISTVRSAITRGMSVTSRPVFVETQYWLGVGGILQ
jgi:hypothetical protein